jgi:hypothetical protein
MSVDNPEKGSCFVVKFYSALSSFISIYKAFYSLICLLYKLSDSFYLLIIQVVINKINDPINDNTKLVDIKPKLIYEFLSVF